MAATTSNQTSVVIIGAGISGLYAAYCLLKEGVDVIVLEGRKRVGGRNQTCRDPDYGYVDLGAGYVGPSQNKILEVLSHLNVPVYRTPIYGKSILWHEGERVLTNGKTLPLKHILSSLDFANVLRTIDKYSLQVPLEEPWLAARAAEWDSISIADFLNSTCWTSLAKMSVSIGFQAVYGIPCSKVSFLNALHTVRSCGGIQALFGSRQGLQELKILGGSDSFCLKLASILGDRIKFNSRVMTVQQENSEVIVKTDDERIFKANRVVIAIHPSLVNNLQFQPPLPHHLKEVCSIKCEESHGIKTVMFYDKPYWRELGLSGEFVSAEGPIYYTLDDTKENSKYAALMGFVDTSYEELSVEERQKAICQQYAKILGISALENPVGYVEKDWKRSDDVVNFQCVCVSSFLPGILTCVKRFWGEKFGHIHFAGAETSPVFRGYMDGALRSAERVTVEILESLNIKSKLQSDINNRQIPYQEALAIERFAPSITQLIWSISVVAIAVLAFVLRASDIV